MKTGDSLSRRAVLVVSIIASFLTPFGISAVNIALPTIGSELGLNAVMLNWVVTIFLLSTAVFLVPFGRISDIYGRKRIFIVGLSVHTLASLLLALTSSVPMLLVCRALQGLGAAMIFGTSVAILISAYPPSERGRVLGINTAAIYLALSTGPAIGGLLTERFGWRSIFILATGIGLIALAGVVWKLKGEWAEARGERFDTAGSLIYSLALVAVMYGLSLMPSATGGLLLATGIAGLVGFVIWETRTPSPVMSLELFRHNTVFTLSNVTALISYSATFAVTFLMSLYLQYIKGYDAEGAGLVLVAMPASQALLSPLAGRLADKVEPRVLTSVGMGVTALGLFLFIFLSRSTNVGLVFTGLVILGCGFGIFSSPNMYAIMSSVEKKFYGVGSGILATMRLLGQMMSMGIALLVFSLYLGRVAITEERYDDFLAAVRTAFIIFTVLCVGAIFASLARGSMRKA